MGAVKLRRFSAALWCCDEACSVSLFKSCTFYISKIKLCSLWSWVYVHWCIWSPHDGLIHSILHCIAEPPAFYCTSYILQTTHPLQGVRNAGITPHSPPQLIPNTAPAFSSSHFRSICLGAWHRKNRHVVKKKNAISIGHLLKMERPPTHRLCLKVVDPIHDMKLISPILEAACRSNPQTISVTPNPPWCFPRLQFLGDIFV